MIICAATAYVFNDSILEIFEAGMDNYLAKPISNEKLENILKVYNVIE